MKTGSREDYQQRIGRVLAHVQAAIEAGDDVPDLDGLAAAAHFSPYHFHRVYRALTGEALGRSIGRLRLAHALHLLADPARAIAAVALDAGYGTPQGFARMVRESLDTTPSALREDPVALAEAIARLREPPRASASAAAGELQVSVVSLAPFEVVAMHAVGRWDDLDLVYGALVEWAAEAGAIERMDGLYGIAWEDRRDVALADFRFTAAIGLAGTHPPAPMASERWGGGRHACLRHVGSFDALETSIDRLLAEWWPDSGESLRAAPLVFRYLDDPEQVPAPLLRTDILLPLADQPAAGASTLGAR